MDLQDRVTWIPAKVEAVEAVSQYTSFDFVINAVCDYGKKDLLYDHVLEANMEFPLKVLNRTVDHGTKYYITIGTGLPYDLNMYSFSKQMLYKFGRFYETKHNINFYSMNLEMFYGEDEPPDRFLPAVIRHMLRGEEVNMTEGTQRRDIIYIGDIILAIMMVIKAGLHGCYEIPVGTGVAPSIGEVIDFIWDETGRKSEIHKGAVPMRYHEPDCIADTSFLRSLGEWNPLPWKKGIRNMIHAIKREQEELGADLK